MESYGICHPWPKSKTAIWLLREHRRLGPPGQPASARRADCLAVVVVVVGSFRAPFSDCMSCGSPREPCLKGRIPGTGGLGLLRWRPASPCSTGPSRLCALAPDKARRRKGGPTTAHGTPRHKRLASHPARSERGPGTNCTASEDLTVSPLLGSPSKTERGSLSTALVNPRLAGRSVGVEPASRQSGLKRPSPRQQGASRAMVTELIQCSAARTRGRPKRQAAEGARGRAGARATTPGK